MGQKPTSRDPRLLRSLHYFDAVARRGSVGLAAEEVGVSSSAVSHQLRELSAMLGEVLVEKAGRGIVLTEAGRRLADRLAATFSDIDGMVADVVGGRTQRLRLAVCSSFGPAWLAPRLPAFLRANPGIDLEMRLYSHDPEQTHAVADAIVTARPIQPGFKAVTLFEEILVAVHRPALGSARMADLPRLITTDPEDDHLGLDWLAFCAQTGQRSDEIGEGDYVRCTHYLLALELAKAGMGVALVPDFLAAESLASGTLIRFDPAPMFSGRTYRLCWKEARGGDPSIQALSRWLRFQAGNAAAPVVRLRTTGS